MLELKKVSLAGQKDGPVPEECMPLYTCHPYEHCLPQMSCAPGVR